VENSFFKNPQLFSALFTARIKKRLCGTVGDFRCWFA